MQEKQVLAGISSEAIEFLTDFRCGICSKKFEALQLLIRRPREMKSNGKWDCRLQAFARRFRVA